MHLRMALIYLKWNLIDHNNFIISVYGSSYGG